MAKPRDPYFDFVEELLAPFGPVAIRKMFGGAGVYHEGVMFALIADGELHLKTDGALREALESAGGRAFIWTRPSDGREIDMGYLTLPPEDAEMPDAASTWARRAYDVALKAKAAAPKKRRKSGAGAQTNMKSPS